ncbi:MAG: carboxypeptidase-like regulatory domain-containing protein [Bacteroidota bacterium]
MWFRYAFLAFLALLLPLAAQAQSVALEGTVRDAATAEPLPGVNVYLAQTLIGTTTDRDGYFVLPQLERGQYEVVFSFVGYTARTTTLAVDGSQDTLQVRVALQPAVVELDGLAVTAERSRQWDRQLRRFERQLIGTSPNAKATQLLNPEVLTFDESNRVLRAEASAPLVVENRALGYRIRFDLQHFVWDWGQRALQYEGASFFEELTPEDERQASRWATAREEAFTGSLQHLMWSVVHDRVGDEGFYLDHVMPQATDGDGRPQFTTLGTLGGPDLVRETAQGYAYEIAFDGWVRVQHGRGEATLDTFIGERDGAEPSYLELSSGAGFAHRSGYVYATPAALRRGLAPVRRTGALAQERLANLLPLEYALERPQAAPVYRLSAQVEAAAAAMQQSQWRSAVRMLDEVVEAQPHLLRPRLMRANARARWSRGLPLQRALLGPKAEADYETVLARDSAYADALHHYALFWRDAEQPARAIPLLEAQLRLKPQNDAAHRDLFWMYHYLLYQRGADQALDWLREHGGHYARFFIAEAVRQNGDLDKAEAMIAYLLDQHPQMPLQPVWLSRARIAYAQGRPVVGQRYVKEAMQAHTRLAADFVLDDLLPILTDDEVAAYDALSTPEAWHAFFWAVWAKRDPMPASSFNVRMAEHYRRLIQAERDFAYPPLVFKVADPTLRRPLHQSAAYARNKRFNDMGIVFIRHGEPADEVPTPEGRAWRYTSPSMDAHFTLTVPGRYDLVTEVTNCDALDDLVAWGARYAQLEPRPSTADVVLADASGQPMRRATSGTGCDADFMAQQRLADQLDAEAAVALTTDTYRWNAATKAFDFPVLFAAFRGADGQTELHSYYQLPAEQLADEDKRAALSVEVGVALHDQAWAPVLRQPVQLPLAGDVRRMRMSVPPDSYHVALHAQVTALDRVGTHHVNVRLPDYMENRLLMSDVVPASRITRRSEATPTDRSDFAIAAEPSATFRVDQLVHLYYEVYHLSFDGDDRTNYRIAYTLQRPDQPRRLLRRASPDGLRLETSSSGTTATLFEHAEIDVRHVPPGTYALTVTITDGNTNEVAERRLPITLTAAE